MTDQFHANSNRENQEAFEAAAVQYLQEKTNYSMRDPWEMPQMESVSEAQRDWMVHVTFGVNPRRSVKLVPVE